MRELSYRARKVGAGLVHVFAALNMNAQVKGIPKRWLGRERIVTIVDGNATAWTLAEAEDLLATMRSALRAIPAWKRRADDA